MTNYSPVVSFTKDRAYGLKNAYEQAVTDGVEAFFFAGKTWLTSYAYHVLGYLATKFCDSRIKSYKRAV
jgi:hypothetical protein